MDWLARCILEPHSWSTNIGPTSSSSSSPSPSFYLAMCIFFSFFFLFLFYSFTRVRPVLPLKAIGVKFVNAPGFSFVCSFVCLSSRIRQTERYLLIFPFLFLLLLLLLLIYVRISLRLVAYPLTLRTCAAVWGIIIHQKWLPKDVPCDL